MLCVWNQGVSRVVFFWGLSHQHTQSYWIKVAPYSCPLKDPISKFSDRLEVRSLGLQQANIGFTYTATAKSPQSCPTLCHPIDGSPPGSPVPGILQARTLEWVAISFSNAGKWKVKVKSLSRVRLLATHGLQPTRLLRPWDFPGKSTGVGCHCLLRLLLSSSLLYGCTSLFIYSPPEEI